MKRSIITIGLIVLVIAILLFTAFFGFELGSLKIAPLEEGIILGLDLVGGSEITYEAEGADSLSPQELATGMETASTMLRQRLNALGFTEANLYTYGTNRIVLEIPNISDPEEAVQMLGTTAVVQFRDKNGNVVLDGSHIENATAAYGPTDSSGVSYYYVSLKLTAEGHTRFAEATREVAQYANTDDRYVAIMMDETEISRPGVNRDGSSPNGIDTDSPIITLGDNATVDYARYLAQIINAGQLPFALRDTRLQAVGAQLGERSLETAIIAGIIGIILVMLYMAFVYKIPGLVADFALLLYISLFLVVMSLFKVNLTLPGIAGIILTIGMAVDANVVIYERIREELISGKTLRSSIDAGFKRAFSAIFDSNLTTIIAAAVLLWQGTGTILGFAKTLLIGVILSMICMLIVPRLILRCFAEMRVTNPKLYGVSKAFDPKNPEEPKLLPLAGKLKITGLISIVLCLTAIVGFVLLPFGTVLFNLDLDFVGGVTMDFEIGQEVTQEVSLDVSDIVREVTGVTPSSVTKSGNGGTVVSIKMAEIGTVEREAVFNAVSDNYGGSETVSIVSSDYVSASVGRDITRSAFLASGLAALLILVYITVRFELRSGFAAIICLIHDVLVMLSIYIIFQIPMNMNFIAAALTIIGYSINATIVVFDRIRENYKKAGNQGDFSLIVDRSITQTMRRSVGTTVTTLLPVLFVVLLGVASIRNFGIPIMVGVISGGYSSVCIAGPLWSKFKGNKAAKAK